MLNIHHSIRFSVGRGEYASCLPGRDPGYQRLPRAQQRLRLYGPEEPDVIGKILAHLAGKAAGPEAARRPPSRGPLQLGLFG